VDKPNYFKNYLQLIWNKTFSAFCQWYKRKWNEKVLGCSTDKHAVWAGGNFL